MIGIKPNTEIIQELKNRIDLSYPDIQRINKLLDTISIHHFTLDKSIEWVKENDEDLYSYIKTLHGDPDGVVYTVDLDTKSIYYMIMDDLNNIIGEKSEKIDTLGLQYFKDILLELYYDYKGEIEELFESKQKQMEGNNMDKSYEEKEKKFKELLKTLDFEECKILFDNLSAGNVMRDVVMDRMEELDPVKFDKFLDEGSHKKDKLKEQEEMENIIDWDKVGNQLLGKTYKGTKFNETDEPINDITSIVFNNINKDIIEEYDLNDVLKSHLENQDVLNLPENKEEFMFYLYTDEDKQGEPFDTLTNTFLHFIVEEIEDGIWEIVDVWEF